MRKLFMLMGCLFALTCALSLGPAVAEASQTCTVSCSSGTSLQCCLNSGSCSTASGSIDCNGTTLTCGPIDAWNACKADCLAMRNYCYSDCNFERTCAGYCNNWYFNCTLGCGPKPQTNIGCP